MGQKTLGFVTYCLFQISRVKANLILDHNVVSWSGSSLKSLVGLEVKVPSLVTVASHMAINDGSWYSVVRAFRWVALVDIGMVLRCWVEASVMTLADNLSSVSKGEFSQPRRYIR